MNNKCLTFVYSKSNNNDSGNNMYFKQDKRKSGEKNLNNNSKINIGKVNLTESNLIPDNENNKPEIIIKQGLTKPKEEKKKSY